MEIRHWYPQDWEMGVGELETTRHALHIAFDQEEIEWPASVWICRMQREEAGHAIESDEARQIDDYEDRREIAALAGLQSLPQRSASNIDELVGLFDSLVEPREQVDVTEWVKRVRQRST